MAFIEVNGTQIEFIRIAGAGNLPPIVMLHEGLGSVAAWRDFPQRLAAATSRTVIAYSRLGYGQSDALAVMRGGRTPRFMHDEAHDTLPALLGEWDVTVPPVLFGHSDGASIALLYASQRPVSGVVVLAPHVVVEDISIVGVTAAKHAYETTDLRAKLAKYHDDVDGAFWGWNDVWLSPEFRHWNIEDELGRIEVPVLAMQGEQDEYGTLYQIESIKTRARNVKLLKLPGCKHSPHRDQPDLVLSATASFLASLHPKEMVIPVIPSDAAGEDGAVSPPATDDLPPHDRR
jgi:pimeloyl-ACP methyl ester carboxylesterase